MKAIFVRSSKEEPYAQNIVDGRKTIETRSRNMLSSLVGEHVAIVETKSGTTPLVVGFVDVVKLWFCPAFLFEMYRDETMIPVGSKYDTNGKGKWFYFLANPEKCNPFPLPANAIRHGRSWCEF